MVYGFQRITSQLGHLDSVKTVSVHKSQQYILLYLKLFVTFELNLDLYIKRGVLIFENFCK